MFTLVVYKLDTFGPLWPIMWAFKIIFKMSLKHYLKMYNVDGGLLDI